MATPDLIPVPKDSRTSESRFVGRWTELENPFDTTSVVYTMERTGEGLHITGIDESDGVALLISAICVDDEKLCFTSVYPPTNHEAAHEFRLTGEDRASHKVTYSGEDGDHTIQEWWIRSARNRTRQGCCSN